MSSITSSRSGVLRVLPRNRRALGLGSLAIVVLAIVGAASMPASADQLAIANCPGGPPVLSLANPNPGDVLSQGDYIVSGMALDPSATSGAGSDGIAHIDVFLGDRDNGGLFLGTASPTGNGDFQIKTTLPSNTSGEQNFFAYAYSSVDGQETSVSVPVFIGPPPTPTPTSSSNAAPAALSETTTSTCRGSGAPVTQPLAPSAQAPAPAASVPAASTTTTTTTAVVSSGPVLSLGNPSPGAVLLNGDVFIDGVAYDPNGGQSVGVDRVEVFLDSRDSGGMLIGTGTPAADRTFSIKASIPSSVNGEHDVFVYAHSSITDQQTVVQVSPVFIGVPPTPTPRPSNGGM